MPFLTPNALGSLIESAVSTRSPVIGKAAHAHIIKTLNSPFPSFLSNHLINMYSKLDLSNSAQLDLSLTPTHLRFVITWTALISGYVQNGHFATALLHFRNMCRGSVKPNDFTLPCVFKACGSLREGLSGKTIHGLSVKDGLMTDVFVGCSAFDLYCKIGLIEDACKMFDKMPERNIATWNAFICNAVQHSRPGKAFSGFISLRRSDAEPNSITFCWFFNACSDEGNLQLGRQMHGFVIRSGFEGDVSVANGMIDFYGKCREISS